MPGTIPIPPEARDAVICLQKHAENSLITVCLHGSAVAGGLHPHSDVDVLALIDRPLTAEIRTRLVGDFMNISGHYPRQPGGRRPLEVIVFLRSDLAPMPYPARSELVYGEWLRHQYGTGQIPQGVSDPEFTLVIAQAQQEAYPLVGAGPTLLPAIPQPTIHRAMADCLPAILDSLQEDERNSLLTLARMWYTIITGHFTTKDRAALWAAARLPMEQAAALDHAREVYLGLCRENWPGQREALHQTALGLHAHILVSL